MGKTQKNSFFKKNADFLVLALVSVIFCLFTVFGVLQRYEMRLYDLLLGVTPEPKESSEILLVEIEDDSIEEIGTWPWTRDILGNALLRMKELGAYSAVFDIEYLEPSAKAAAPNAEDRVLSSISAGEKQIAQALDQMGREISAGTRSVPQSQMHQFLMNTVLREQIDPVFYSLSREVLDTLSRNNDEIFATNVQFFGNAWLTMNLRNIYSNPEGIEYASERFLWNIVSDPHNRIEQGNEASFREEIENLKEETVSAQRSLVPALSNIIDHAAGAGFTNVYVDSDGTRRRIELLNQYNGKYAGQLAFSPLLDYLSVEHIERKKHSLVLSGVHLPQSNEATTITIPLDEKGRMLINWQHGEYADSFRHESVMFLYLLDLLESESISCVSYLADLLPLDASEEAQKLLEDSEAALVAYDEVQEMLSSLLASCYGFEVDGSERNGRGIQESDYNAYFALRESFYSAMDLVLENLNEVPFLFESEILAADYADARDAFLSDWSVFREYLTDMKTVYKDSVCFIGYTAAASTDFGVTPFSRSYANLGTHANVFNTILQRDFITPVSEWWGIVATILLCLASIIVCRQIRSAGKKNLFSLVYVLVPLVVPVLLMLCFKIFMPFLVPVLIGTVTYIVLLVLRFVDVINQSAFLKNTFGAYVAPEVVSQIIKNPEVAQLGGSDKNITALFSDVKSFSKFSETVNDPVRLVQILNEYLGALSDAIMDNRGTIDKYVGDEIVSFFGAPLENPNHAFDALCAGIRMKQAEAEYNKKHFEVDHDIPFALESRVGVNSGLMVVGNMGTEKKLNYTIMGNNVNLASRLEGVNKVYGTWIMCSENTWKQADSGKNEGVLLSRRLDKVRVININTPVQIYSVLGKKSELPAQAIEAAHIFNEGSDLYLQGDFEKALKLFRDAARCYAQDPSSEVFARRCEQFIKEGKPQNWDGVYTMVSK